MSDRYNAPWSINFNGKTTLTDSVVKTLTFKNTAGETTKCKQFDIRLDPALGWAGKVHMKLHADPDAASSVANTNFYLEGSDARQVKAYMCSKVEFLSIDAGALTCDIYVDCYSDEDIASAAFA